MEIESSPIALTVDYAVLRAVLRFDRNGLPIEIQILVPQAHISSISDYYNVTAGRCIYASLNCWVVCWDSDGGSKNGSGTQHY